MKVCLIQPPQAFAAGAATMKRPCIPLGLAYLAASLREAGHEVQVLDAVAAAPEQLTPFNERIWLLGIPDDEILSRIAPDAGLIGVGMMFSFNWPYMRRLMQLIKRHRPDTPLVLGGEAATAMWSRCMEEVTAIDAVVQGEGEETIVQLAGDCAGDDWRARLAEVPGISFRDGERVVQNPRRARIRDVDDVPWPAWDLFDIDAYRDAHLENGLRRDGEPPTLPMLATRGCPYACTFCTSPNMWTQRYYKRDAKLVVDEIEHNVRTWGVTNFPFQDLTAIIDRKWILEFCNELIERKLNISWQMPTGTRSEVIDDEVAEALYRSGMFTMGYAPESGSDRIRKLIKKRIKAEQFYASVRAAVKHKLRVQSFTIIGFPFETRRDILHTMKMLARLALMGVHDIGINPYMALPGTEINETMDREWLDSLGDDFYFIPLFTHNLILEDWRRANRRIPCWELTLYQLACLVLFYGLSFVSHPRKLWGFVRGLFTSAETSRMQVALKQALRVRAFGSASPGAALDSPPRE